MRARKTNRFHRTVPALVAGLTLLVGGCGSGETEPTTKDSRATATSTKNAAGRCAISAFPGKPRDSNSDFYGKSTADLWLDPTLPPTRLEVEVTYRDDRGIDIATEPGIASRPATLLIGEYVVLVTDQCVKGNRVTIYAGATSTDAATLPEALPIPPNEIEPRTAREPIIP